jgi:glycosyltransferase involved in cell wall biosynthesis
MLGIVFWQYGLSIHQSALLRNLAATSGVNVTLVVEEEVTRQRMNSGWYKSDFGKTRIIVAPSINEQDKILEGRATHSIHIFPGSRGGSKLAWKAFCKCICTNQYVGIYSESPNVIGVKGFLRLTRSRYNAIRYKKRVSFMLGIGDLGVHWFKKSGYQPDRIYPFGYFVETPSPLGDKSHQFESQNRFFELIFVAQFISRKGWDILLNALHGLKNLNWRLSVVGDGRDKKKFVQLCAKLGFTDSVIFYGKLPNSKVINLIYKSDLLVLPSRWDGWGAVVNEALMCGVPVVCSDKCGAAVLLDGDDRGEVFASGSIQSLHSALKRWISQGKKDPLRSEKIRNWSKCISGETAANYLIAVINASLSDTNKPNPPWYPQ